MLMIKQKTELRGKVLCRNLENNRNVNQEFYSESFKIENQIVPKSLL